MLEVVVVVESELEVAVVFGSELEVAVVVGVEVVLEDCGVQSS